MAIEIVGLPINSMVIFHGYVGLPEGMLNYASEFTMLTENQRCCLELSISLSITHFFDE